MVYAASETHKGLNRTCKHARGVRGACFKAQRHGEDSRSFREAFTCFTSGFYHVTTTRCSVSRRHSSRDVLHHQPDPRARRRSAVPCCAAHQAGPRWYRAPDLAGGCTDPAARGSARPAAQWAAARELKQPAGRGRSSCSPYHSSKLHQTSPNFTKLTRKPTRGYRYPPT